MLNLNICLPGKGEISALKASCAICAMAKGLRTQANQCQYSPGGSFCLHWRVSSTSHFHYSEKCSFDQLLAWSLQALISRLLPMIITALSLCLSGKSQYSSIIPSLLTSPMSYPLAAGLVPWRGNIFSSLSWTVGTLNSVLKSRSVLRA